MIHIPPKRTAFGTETPSVAYPCDVMGGWIGDLRDTRSVTVAA
jgi:hypothetical protein